jgi:alpha,alpha-trehalase
MTGPATFVLRCHCGRDLAVSGAYPLSNLLQELADGNKEIDLALINENPVHRLSRLIREKYWNNLTRRILPENYEQVAADPKLPGRAPLLYIPDRDVFAKQIFIGKNFVALPDQVGAEYFKSIRDRHGLLYLPKPYVVPGGRFNEMYGWDSYFESLGLIQDGRAELALAMADNFIYEIENYGKILNGNRTYYLNRSQPPFLTSLIMALRPYADKDWIERALKAAIKEYNSVWMTGERITPTGLSRYYGSDFGVPPEVEKGHFDETLGPAARRHGISVEKLTALYNEGRLADKAVTELLAHDRAVRESGHDTTYRWKVKGQDRAADFVTVDLNSLLYKYETDLAQLTGDGVWSDRAARRKNWMMKYLWDEKRQMFFDYNWREGYRSTFVSATAFYPLWAKLLDPERAKASAAALLGKLEAPGGLLSNDQASLTAVHAGTKPRQWDYPNGWHRTR